MNEIITILPMLIVVAIPVSAIVRIIGAVFSLRVRVCIRRHPIAHVIWLAAALLVFISTFFLPPLNKPSRGKKWTAPNPAAPSNAGNASRLTIEHRWPGMPEPGRWAFMKPTTYATAK